MNPAEPDPAAGFSVVGSTPAASTPFLEIEELEIRVPDGSRHARTVVRHPGAVGIVPVAPGGERVLLVRQYRSSIDRDLLEIPAGKRDVPGEPPEETAARELHEEIGHRAGRLVPLASFYNSPGFCDELSHLYAALDLEPTDGPRPVGPEEHAMRVESVALADLDRLIAEGEMADGKSIIGLLLTRQYLAGDLPAVG